jgi:protein-disulfide isomerase
VGLNPESFLNPIRKLILVVVLPIACFGSDEPKTIATNGDASKGVVTIIEFADFQCPFCARQAPELRKLQAEYPGKVNVILKNFPLPFHQLALGAHRAVLAAQEQGKFWEMHDLLYSHPGRLSADDLDHYASELGLDMERFHRVMQAQSVSDSINSDIAEGQRLGVSGTPTLFVNGHKLVGVQGYTTLKSAIESELQGQPWLVPASRVPVAPEKLNISIAGAPSRGPQSAPVTVVEFSDFQCPFCARARLVVQQLLQDYPSQVRLIFKHFPLSFHQDSLLAHQAALAAGEQGKFWEMHDLIFSHQNALKRDDLIRAAEQLGLDKERFVADMDSDHLKSFITRDQDEGTRLGVGGTPTFYINGRELEGVASESEFKALIDQALASKGSSQDTTDLSNSESDKYALGPASAPVTIIWFTDLQSALAPKAAQLLKQLMNAYPEKIHLVLKHRPLEIHPDAMLAHKALLAAGTQGKFWEMNDLLLIHQNALKQENLIAYAAGLGLDKQKFTDELQNPTHVAVIQADLVEAQRREVRGTPVFFVNGNRIDGIVPFSLLSSLVTNELKKLSVARR